MMQQLKNATNRRPSPGRCARELITTVPAIMRYIRTHMRQNREGNLSVPQFRTLIFLTHHEETSLSALAEHLTLSVSATSRLVDGLVRRAIVVRKASTKDRRRVHLSLTPKGKHLFDTARDATECAMAECFMELSTAELKRVAEAATILTRIFGFSEAFKRHQTI